MNRSMRKRSMSLRGVKRAIAALAVIAVAVTGLTVTGTPAQAAGAATVTITQTGADTQPSGSTFTYRLSVTCSVIDGNCLEDGFITIPLDDWGVFTPTTSVVFQNPLPDGVESANSSWYAGVGQTEIRIKLADIGTEGASFDLDFSITTRRGTPDGFSWTLQPTLKTWGEGQECYEYEWDGQLYEECYPAQVEEVVHEGNAVTSTTTASRIAPAVEKVDTTPAGTYYPGQTVGWNLRSFCTVNADGLEVPASGVITDVLPAGVTFSRLAVHPQLGGSVPAYDYDETSRALTIYGMECNRGVRVEATIDADQVDGTVLTNTAEWEFSWHAGDTTLASDSEDLTIIAAEPPTGTYTKSALATIQVQPYPNQLYGSFAGPWLADRSHPNVASEPETEGAFGRFLRFANGTMSVQSESTYTVGLAHDGPDGSAQWAVIDDVPCLTSPAPASGIYVRAAGGALCATPAWHLTGITVVGQEYSLVADVPELQPKAVLVDGTEIELEFFGANGSYGYHTRNWVVPEAHIGQVARILLPEAEGFDAKHQISFQGYIDGSLDERSVLRNVADVSMTSPGEDAPFHEGSTPQADIVTLKNPVIGISKNHQNIDSDTGRFVLNARVQSPLALQEDVVIVDVLPAGFPSPFANGQMQGIRSSVNQSADIIEVPTEVVPRSDGTTLLRWRIPAAELNTPAFRPIGTAGGTYGVYITFEYDKSVLPEGDYVNKAAVFHGSADTLRNSCLPPLSYGGTAVVDDPENLDGDLRTSFHCSAERPFTIEQPAGRVGMNLTKEVKGESDADWLRNPGIGMVPELGGAVDYRLTWRNLSDAEAVDIVMYDVLPRVGDTGTVPGTSNTPRGSAFTPELVSATAPAGGTVEYSTAEIPCRPELLPTLTAPACTDDWSATPPADLAEVTALRFVHPGPVARNDTLTALIEMSTETIDGNDIAWNTAAAAASVQEENGEVRLITPIESPRVGLTRDSSRGMTVAKTADVREAIIGEEITYTLSVASTGVLAVDNVEITDTLPPHTEFVSASHGGTHADGVVTWNLGTLLGMPATRDVTVTVRVLDEAEGTTLLNRAEAIGDSPIGEVPGDPTPETVCDDDATQVCAEVTVPERERSLSIEKVVDRASAKPGEGLTYTVTVKNTGEVDLIDVSVTDVLPAGVEFVSASDGGQHADGDVSWLVTNLVVGEEVTFTVAATVAASAEGATLVNSVTAAGEDPTRPVDPNDPDGPGTTVPGNPTPETVCEDDPDAACAVTVVPMLDRGLSISKTVDRTTANPGDQLMYTVIARNTGEVDLTDVVVTDFLPKGVEFISASHGGTAAANVVTWTIDSLPVGQSSELTVVVRTAANSAGQTVVNSVTAVGQPPEPGSEFPGTPTPETVCEDNFWAACATTVIEEKNSLGLTGASISGAVAIGVLLSAAGLLLVLRRRKEQAAL